MNMVIDETIEECKDGTKNNIGMVVSYITTYEEQITQIKSLYELVQHH